MFSKNVQGLSIVRGIRNVPGIIFDAYGSRVDTSPHTIIHANDSRMGTFHRPYTTTDLVNQQILNQTVQREVNPTVRRGVNCLIPLWDILGIYHRCDFPESKNLQLLATRDESVIRRVNSSNLLWLRWYNCTHSYLPSWTPLKNLRVLDVEGNKLDTLWQQNSQVKAKAFFPSSLFYGRSLLLMYGHRDL